MGFKRIGHADRSPTLIDENNGSGHGAILPSPAAPANAVFLRPVFILRSWEASTTVYVWPTGNIRSGLRIARPEKTTGKRLSPSRCGRPMRAARAPGGARPPGGGGR